VLPFSDTPVCHCAEKALEFITGRGLLQAPNNAAVVPAIAGTPGIGEMPLEEVQLSWPSPVLACNASWVHVSVVDFAAHHYHVSNLLINI
jgi:hypothetical protein